jgi:nondiscriminating glutamyl-tRNA synthetase
LSESDVMSKKEAGIPFVVRFKMPDNGAYHFSDLIRGDIVFDLNLISDFVMIKSDGGPSYNFAVVVDDVEMAISHVVRGEDHISNTPRQLVIYEALGVIPPRFAHLPMILGPDRSKLSKRHGATSVSEYISIGYLPEALLNYLALLGWSSPDGQELMSRADIVRQFSLDRVSKSGAIFDIAKLNWMNGQYIRKLSPEALSAVLKPYLSPETMGWLSGFDAVNQMRILYSVRDNLDVLSDINGYVAVYGFDATTYASKLAEFQVGDADRDVVSVLLAWLAGQSEVVSSEQIQAGLDHVLAQTKLPKGKVFKPIRLASSGVAQGPHLPELLSILPKSVLMARLEAFVG